MAFWLLVDCLSIHCEGNSPSEVVSPLRRDPGIFQGMVFRKLSSLKKKKIWSRVCEGTFFQNHWLQEPHLDHCGGSSRGFAFLLYDFDGRREAGLGWSLREVTAHLMFPVKASVLFLSCRLEVCMMFQWVMVEKPASQPAVYETS